MKKVIVLIIIILCSFLLFKTISKIKNKTIILKQCVMMIENIEIMLKYNSFSTEEILFNLINSGYYNKLSFLKNFYEKIKNNSFSQKNITFEFENNYLCKYLEKEDLENLKGFFQNIGTTNVNTQIVNCEFYKEIFKKKLLQIESQEKNKIKTVTVIIVSISVCLVIIIL